FQCSFKRMAMAALEKAVLARFEESRKRKVANKKNHLLILLLNPVPSLSVNLLLCNKTRHP
ncbi:MAG: hypothetical protein Q8R42_06160, partial [Desulfocapsaceae bacterium]|nr:hypothetical protein [Desulfocapsaceae bacterium]